jgi:hypothetical protein
MHVIVFMSNSKEQACQMKDIFIIKKLVRGDSCDSIVPGKIKKIITIMASTSRASRKTVEDAEIQFWSSLQNAVYFITLPFLVPVLFAFYLQCVLKIKCQIPVPKG